MIFFCLLILLASWTGDAFLKESSPVVQTNLGGIRGSYKESFSGRRYEAYEGIPYALPPTGERRFKEPEPVVKWTGNLSATKVASSCTQYAQYPVDKNNRVEGNEDCLYLNIYVPSTNRTTPLPILFAIHGGAFQFGKAFTAVQFIMDKNVIVVAPNYRVGPFGFLSTKDSVVPGNMGLKDQSLALRWVSENIGHFGGDAARVTLIGNSAGAASVHYHYLSHMSRGLFRNGISFSGTALGPSKQMENAREKAFKLAASLGCPTGSTTEIVECLRHKPARSISQATSNFMPWLYNPYTPFGPVVEENGDNPFIDRPPVQIIKSGDIADGLWITGDVSEEGLYPASDFINDDKLLKDLDMNWESIAPHLLDYNFTVPLEMHAHVARKIRKHYLGTKSIDKNTVKELVYMIGDRLYAVDGEKGARWHAKVSKSPVLFSYYSYRASTSLTYGVAHGADMYMIFRKYVPSAKINPEDRAMQIKMIDFVVSVADKGYPDMGLEFQWIKVDPTKEEFDYLHIAAPADIKMGKNDNFGQKKFWSTIDFDENRVC